MSMNDTIASEALAAAVGGAVSSGVLYPLEVLKTRMQADDTTEGEKEINHDDDDEEDTGVEEISGDDNNKTSSSITAIDYARNLYNDEGMGVFLDGMEVSAFQSAIEKALYFFAYTALKRGYARARTRGQNNHQLSAVSSVLLGCLAEWVHLPVTLPMDALTTAIQTSGNSATTKNEKRQKTQDVLALWMVLWKEKSFYKGIEAYWILCFKPALQYAIFEQLKSWKLRLKKGKDQLSAGEAFLLGMFSRTVATLVVFPFVRAKVRMQKLGRAPSDTAKEEGSSTSPATIWKLLAESYDSGGLKALYQGLGPELTRGVLSAALMMMVKERISGGVKKILHSR